MPNRGSLRLVRSYRLTGAAAAFLLTLSLTEGSAAAARRPAADSPEPPLDVSRFLVRTMPIGNLGSVTCNGRRYAINADWTLLAAPLDNGSVRLYDLATGEALPPLEGGFKVGTFTYTYAVGVPPAHFGFSPDGRTLVWTWGKKIVRWDVASREVLERREVEGSSWGMSFSLFGGDLHQKVAVASPAPPTQGAGPQAQSADGRLVAYVNANNDVEVQGEAGAARVLPSREKDKHGRCTVFDNGLTGTQLLFSRDGRILCDSCRVTDIWDLSESLPRLLVRTGRLRDTAGRPVLSPDGRSLAYTWGTGGAFRGDGGFALFDAEGARRAGPYVEVKFMGAMQFSPDSKYLATVGWVPGRGRKTDFEVQIWDVEALRSAEEASRVGLSLR
jgi:WD40 repeat protein